MFFRNLLLSTEVPAWVAQWFPILQTILIILIAILAIAIIVAVMVQPSKPQGGRNVVLGTNNDSYYAQNKGKTKEGRLNKIIIISSVCIFVFTILYFISFGIYSG